MNSSQVDVAFGAFYFGNGKCIEISLVQMRRWGRTKRCKKNQIQTETMLWLLSYRQFSHSNCVLLQLNGSKRDVFKWIELIKCTNYLLLYWAMRCRMQPTISCWLQNHESMFSSKRIQRRKRTRTTRNWKRIIFPLIRKWKVGGNCSDQRSTTTKHKSTFHRPERKREKKSFAESLARTM